MGLALGLSPQAPCSEETRILKDLHVARIGLIKDRTRLRNRAQTQDIGLLQRQTKARILHVERQITELNAEITNLIASQEVTARSHDILCSIPGFGKVTAAAVLTIMPEIGGFERKQIACLAGLAPITRQSGQWRGKSSIQGGRKPLRDALYMPALVAMRFNPDLKAKYDQLRTAGKPAKVAIVAVMRKLIEMANALVKADRKWTPKLARSRRILLSYNNDRPMLHAMSQNRSFASRP